MPDYVTDPNNLLDNLAERCYVESPALPPALGEIPHPKVLTPAAIHQALAFEPLGYLSELPSIWHAGAPFDEEPIAAQWHNPLSVTFGFTLDNVDLETMELFFGPLVPLCDRQIPAMGVE